MPIPLVALAAGGFLLLKGKKAKKIIDVSKGPVGSGVKGAGVGAFVNYLDGKFLGGTLQKLKVGSAQKGMNLNAADAVTVLIVEGTKGFSMSKGRLIDTAAVIGGKKIGEFTGAIDPLVIDTKTGSVTRTPYNTSGGLNA